MAKNTQYTAKLPDNNGIVSYTDEENTIWQDLYLRQIDNLPGRACDEYLQGLSQLNLSKDRIPQLPEVDDVLLKTTGWKTAAVPALISFGRFFDLLANRQFPVATFIRSREEFDYLEEPDIFHEIFGHCPLLTNQCFADFSETYGKLGLAASKEDRVFLARLYWFTVEFGLLRHTGKLGIYGGGILSSPGETFYALGTTPVVRDFNLIDVLRTPYRINIMQPIYYVIENLNFLAEITKMDIIGAISEAKNLGLFDPLYEPEPKQA